MNAPTFPASAPPFPVNPSVGERHGNWVWNGATWVCAPTTGIQVLVQQFGASGPYMPSPGLVSCTVETWGGGGGGGGAIANPTFTAMGGGGGGSGGYSRMTLPAVLVAGGVQVTIGQGGAGGTTSFGASGGQTTFGALCVANGGGGGTTANATSSGYGGAPATPGVGDITFAGNGGLTGGYALPGEEVEIVAGMGGGAPVGGGSSNVGATLNGTTVVVPGPPGLSSGAGGGGAASANAAAAPAGGTGATGACIVTEYCWASAAGDDCWNPPINVNARVAIVNDPCWPGPGPCPPGWGGGPFIENE